MQQNWDYITLHNLIKILADESFLLGCQLFWRTDKNFLLFHFCLDFLPGFIECQLLPDYNFIDVLKNLAGWLVKGLGNEFLFKIHGPFQSCDTHAEKLVQIIGKYTDKPDTQMQRHLPVHRFLQDTLIKGKPGNVSRIELIRHSINFFCFKNSKIRVVTLLN